MHSKKILRVFFLAPIVFGKASMFQATHYETSLLQNYLLVCPIIRCSKDAWKPFGHVAVIRFVITNCQRQSSNFDRDLAGSYELQPILEWSSSPILASSQNRTAKSFLMGFLNAIFHMPPENVGNSSYLSPRDELHDVLGGSFESLVRKLDRLKVSMGRDRDFFEGVDWLLRRR